MERVRKCISPEKRLLLSIFYDPDMQIYVDGKKVDGKSIQGLTGVKLSAGTHTVTMKYRTPGLQAGAVLSILIAGMLGIVWIICMRKGKHRFPD